MKHLTSDSERALYIWDYFYLANVPRPGDEAAWTKIERATHRIRESEVCLGPSQPPDERLRHARRVRNAVRLALRQIEQLSTVTERWVVDGLAQLEATATGIIVEMTRPAETIH